MSDLRTSRDLAKNLVEWMFLFPGGAAFPAASFVPGVFGYNSLPAKRCGNRVAMKTRRSGFISRRANVDGTSVHYTIGGSGPAVVLLHGFAETSRM